MLTKEQLEHALHEYLPDADGETIQKLLILLMNIGTLSLDNSEAETEKSQGFDENDQGLEVMNVDRSISFKDLHDLLVEYAATHLDLDDHKAFHFAPNIIENLRKNLIPKRGFVISVQVIDAQDARNPIRIVHSLTPEGVELILRRIKYGDNPYRNLNEVELTALQFVLRKKYGGVLANDSASIRV